MLSLLNVDDLVEENVRHRRLLFEALDLIFREAPSFAMPVHTSAMSRGVLTVANTPIKLHV
jgi:hypothetical protein